MAERNIADPFSDIEQANRALREADRMAILASEMRQMGFTEIAKFLRENSRKALKWAANR